MDYYDEGLNLLEDPDLSDKLIEERVADGRTYTVLVPLSADQAEARRRVMAAMAAQPTALGTEDALADLGAYVAKLEARVAELEGLCDRLHGDFCARAVGTEDTVLFESTRRDGMMFGFTGSYRRVKVPYDRSKVNAVCRVKLGAMDETHDLLGEILD